MPLLEVSHLRTSFHTRRGVFRAVDDVSFTLERGEILGIVGESGSGKSVTCSSLLRLLPTPPARIEGTHVNFDGLDLLRATEAEMRAVRGKRISMIFQDPMTSLNPYLRISDQLIEPLLIHEKISRRAALDRALAMLEAVGIQDAANRLHAHPHEFSGGMRQRVMIAMALITRPDILIADEPTTALDVTVQAQILELIKKLQRELGMAVIFVTHDLGIVSGLCDRVQVMYAGRIMESASTRAIFTAPRHPYTRALQRCVPSLQEKGRRLFTIPGLPPDLSKPIDEKALLARFDFSESDAAESAPPAPRPDLAAREVILEVKELHTHFAGKKPSLFRHAAPPIRAVDGVSFSLKRGEVLGLVGESGSGKSTIARSIMRLAPVTSGAVLLGGRDLGAAAPGDHPAARRDLQMVFQDPFASLNPRMTIFATLAEPLRVHKICPLDAIPARVAELMQQVGLSPRDERKYPHEFSGGQRQRIAIARALALNPKVIIADEPVSALDVSIQGQIINLLADLVRRLDLTLIFISHDLSVVKHVSDRVAVLYRGKIVECGPTLEVMENPRHDYTRTLLAAVPHIQR
jgi:oligopeptide/dipeptide ABC transporter ATP-binding protein